MLKLNLEELISWGMERKVTGSIYSDDRIEAKKVRFDKGEVTSTYGNIKGKDVFTINKPEEYEFK